MNSNCPACGQKGDTKVLIPTCGGGIDVECPWGLPKSIIGIDDITKLPASSPITAIEFARWINAEHWIEYDGEDIWICADTEKVCSTTELYNIYLQSKNEQRGRESFEDYATSCGACYRTVRVSDRLPKKKGNYFTIWPAIDVGPEWKDNFPISGTGLEVHLFDPETDAEDWNGNVKFWLEEIPKDTRPTTVCEDPPYPSGPDSEKSNRI